MCAVHWCGQVAKPGSSGDWETHVALDCSQARDSRRKHRICDVLGCRTRLKMDRSPTGTWSSRRIVPQMPICPPNARHGMHGATLLGQTLRAVLPSGPLSDHQDQEDVEQGANVCSAVLRVRI